MDNVITLYGKATLKEGYAMIIEKDVAVYGSDVPDSYKMIFDSQKFIYNDSNVDAAYETYELEEREGADLYVNGELITFTEEDNGRKTISVTAGETYNIEYRTTYMKADLDYLYF